MRCWRQIKDTFPLSSVQFRGGFDLIQFPSNLPPSRTLECVRLRVKCRMGGWGKKWWEIFQLLWVTSSLKTGGLYKICIHNPNVTKSILKSSHSSSLRHVPLSTHTSLASTRKSNYYIIHYIYYSADGAAMAPLRWVCFVSRTFTLAYAPIQRCREETLSAVLTRPR